MKYSDIFKGESTPYSGALALMKDYYKAQMYYCGGYRPYTFMARASRFFAGAWNRKNIVAVSEVIKTHDPAGTGEAGEDASVDRLLNDLKTSLLAANQPINPKGELAARINYIQTECNITIIDIPELNAEINQKQPPSRFCFKFW